MSLLTDRQKNTSASLRPREARRGRSGWEIYQAMVAAYREFDRAKAKAKMEKVDRALSKKVPDTLEELGKLGRTLTNARRRAGVLRATWAPATVRRRRSTAGSNTCAAPPSASATSPTTSPAASSNQAASAPLLHPQMR